MKRTVSGLCAVAAAVLLSACSAQTKASLDEMQKNGAHFASWNHMAYSLQRGTPATTTREDILASRNDRCLPNQTCTWWGEVVRVEPIQ
jgi:hypothetical protein